MTMNGDPNIPQDATSRSFALRLRSLLTRSGSALNIPKFKQLGLLVGSLVFWEDQEEDQNDPQPQRLEKLMRWALNLPHVVVDEESYYPHLGVSAQGLALIYYTMLQAKEPPFSDAIEAEKKAVTKVLTHLRIPLTSTSGYIPDPYKYRHFEPHIADIAEYVKCLSKDSETARPHISATTRRKYIWLYRKDIDWWVTAIRKTLDDYLLLIRDKKLSVPDVERLGGRLECSVFAPLDISQPLPAPGLPLDKDMQKRLTDRAEEVDEAVKRVCGIWREPRYLYLTWDLFAFDFWQDHRYDLHLVQRTVLALWAAWPRDRIWAPMPPAGFSSPSFSLEEATHLLTHLLRALRGYFFEIKDAYYPPPPPLTFASKTLYSPTFYFADPTTRLPTTDKYTENEDIRHLISNCIGYDDPYAETLSWSTLEGSIATVRGETTQPSHHKVRYLLLPIAARPAQDKEIGSDLDHIVDFLTYHEYTIGLTAADISKQAEDIEHKRGVDSETINTVDFITRKLANLVSTSPGEALKSSAEEFAELQLLLGRVQYAIEKMRGEAILIERWHDRLVNFNKEYQRENMIMAPVSNLLCLSAALKDNYPYRSFQNLMGSLSTYIRQLANSSERLGALLKLLSTAMSNYTLKQRERQDRQIQIFVAILAIATVLVGLPTFFPGVDAPFILTIFGHGSIYNSNNVKIVLVVIAIALLVFLLWVYDQILQRVVAFFGPKKERKRFRECVRKFWNLSDHTTYMYEAKKRSEKGLRELPPALHRPPPNCFKNVWDSGLGADKIDSQATTILQELWSNLDKLSQESHTNMQRTRSDDKQQASKDIIAQVRLLRNLIHVFVLRPDLIPLPRALCILRYKSLQFLDEWTVADNEFRDSLVCAGFTPDQVERLQKWLNEPLNQNRIRDKSVSVAEVAQALKNAGVTVPPPKDVVDRWHGNLFS